MKKIVLALAMAVATAAAANAQTAAKAPAAKPANQTKSTKAPAAAHTEKAAPIHGEVVSTDATAKTITVKDASGSNVTLTATGAAIAELS